MFESADSPMKSDFSPDACSRMREKKSFALFLPHEIYGVDAREERNYTAANQILQPHEIFGVDAREERNFSNMAGNHLSSYSVFPSCSQHSVFSASHIHIMNNPSHSNVWIIDTGATDHMVSSISFLTTITAVVSKKVKLPNGSFAEVTHVGTVKISATFILKNVLCVPSFTFNLISASKLTKNHKCCLIFLAGFCFIQNLLTWKTIGLGEEKSGLFHLIMQADHALHSASITSTDHASSSLPFKDASNDVWHFRLGHISTSRINLLHSLVPAIECNPKAVCSVCPLAKQRKLSFPVSSSKSNSVFDIVHCDIWGPFQLNQ
jgi:hypothetical protein